ncbi:MAG: peptide chain release factor N(5)-glutamine methyltransferase [Bacteroides sp.]|jgi:protein-(glutamine-N5) methyltransferase, release factor-specific
MNSTTAGALLAAIKNAIPAWVSPPEAKAHLRIIAEHLTDSDYYSLYANPSAPVDATLLGEAQRIGRALGQHKPLQQILGVADFYGRSFTVNRHVLIPRRETEELCALVLGQLPAPTRAADLGTGSGCIAITLGLERRDWQVEGVDLMPAALAVARGNAKRLQANVDFYRGDMLAHRFCLRRPPYGLIVSNPPYIPKQEQTTLPQDVRGYEPPSALFTPSNNPLLYYHALARIGLQSLQEGGLLAVEGHEGWVEQVAELLRTYHYAGVKVHADAQGKARFATGWR